METLETDYTEMQLGRECANICIPRDRFVYTTYDDDGDNTENWLQFCSVVLLCLENDYYPLASLSLYAKCTCPFSWPTNYDDNKWIHRPVCRWPDQQTREVLWSTPRSRSTACPHSKSSHPMRLRRCYTWPGLSSVFCVEWINLSLWCATCLFCAGVQCKYASSWPLFFFSFHMDCVCFGVIPSLLLGLWFHPTHLSSPIKHGLALPHLSGTAWNNDHHQKKPQHREQDQQLLHHPAVTFSWLCSRTTALRTWPIPRITALSMLLEW